MQKTIKMNINHYLTINICILVWSCLIKPSGTVDAHARAVDNPGSASTSFLTTDEVEPTIIKKVECPATFYFKKVNLTLGQGNSILTYSFHCTMANGEEGVMSQFYCKNETDCQETCKNQQLSASVKESCWKKDKDTPPSSETEVDNNYNNCSKKMIARNFQPFLVTCSPPAYPGDENEEIKSSLVVGSVVFFGVRQGSGHMRPKIYFGGKYFGKNGMIYMEPISNIQLLGTIVHVKCVLSGYVGTVKFQFALEMDDDKDLKSLDMPTGSESQLETWDDLYATWTYVMDIKLDDVHIRKIHCFGKGQVEYPWLYSLLEVQVKPFLVDDKVGITTTKMADEPYVNKHVVAMIVYSLILMTVVFVPVVWLCRRLCRRTLTDREMREFLEGNLRLPHHPNPNYCLPYDRKFEINQHHFLLTQSKLIGVGEFGIIMRGSVLKDGVKHRVAVKMAKSSLESFLEFLQEIKMMVHLQGHPNIVALVAACTVSMKTREAYAAMEYCANGDLQKYLRRNRKSLQNSGTPIININSGNDDLQSARNFSMLLKFAQGIASGMKYLSQRKVVHRDLATRNIFLTKKMEVKIGDFGLSCIIFDSCDYVQKREKVAWKWMSIEALKEGKYSIKSDVWSFGVVLWEIFSLADTPYADRLSWSQEFSDKLAAGYRLTIPQFSTPEIYELMKICWHLVVWKRPNFEEIYQKIVQLISQCDEQNGYFVTENCLPPE